MSSRLLFYFDFSCPYAYLASRRVEALAASLGSELVWCPVLLGGLLRSLGQPTVPSAAMASAKAAHQREDIRRAAALSGLTLAAEPGERRTVDALRLVLVAPLESRAELIHALFEMVWQEDRDLASASVLRDALDRVGLPPTLLDAAVSTQRAGGTRAGSEGSSPTDLGRAALHHATDEALARGVFGVPTLVTDAGTDREALFFGQDRIDQLTRLRGLGPAPLPDASSAPAVHSVELYFDYASPFAYLATQRAERLLGGALRMRPMLLGAVFRQVEMHNIPIAMMSAARRRNQLEDLHRQARLAGVPFAWPEHFPLRSVLPLRMTLLVGADTPAGRALLHALMRAYWGRGEAIDDPRVAARIADSVGFDGEGLVERCASPEAKAALFSATTAALQAGVFGAPGIVVNAEPQALFWGSDRLELATRVARGATELLGRA